MQSRYASSFYTRNIERGTIRLENFFKTYAIVIHQKITHIQVYKHDMIAIMCEPSVFIEIAYLRSGSFIQHGCYIPPTRVMLSNFCKMTN